MWCGVLQSVMHEVLLGVGSGTAQSAVAVLREEILGVTMTGVASETHCSAVHALRDEILNLQNS